VQRARGKTNLSDRKFYTPELIEFLEQNNIPNNPSLLTLEQHDTVRSKIVELAENTEEDKDENWWTNLGRDDTLNNRWRAAHEKYGWQNKPSESVKTKILKKGGKKK
jgi:hypothetical protein